MNKHTLSNIAALVALSAGCAALTLPAGAQTISGGKLPTRWAKDVSATNALNEYPRPQMTRTQWINLNGPWDYGLTPSAATTPPDAYEGKMLVPFVYESPLSGIGKASPTEQRLWYRRRFTVPAVWKGQNVLLHFGAVNWDSTVTVNGKAVGGHRGGYTGFGFDITDALKPGINELVVSAWNPLKTDSPDSQVLGKQRKNSGGIFYTGASGIWQTVWMEPAPAAHIADVKITPDIDAGVVHVTVSADGAPDGAAVQVTTVDGKTVVAKASGKTGAQMDIPIKKAKLWSPDSPHLYGLTASLTGKNADRVNCYFAMRKISLGKDAQGMTRLMLNNQFVFQVGLLDQGYWPDGIYTAPTDEALRYDVEVAKKLGYNLLRKHAKVEPARWYYWTDKLGMLVWQDMPQAFGDNFTVETKAQWRKEWTEEIAQFSNFPSIVVWTPFNEGWGQHDTEEIVAYTRQLDPSRLIDNASGWVDKGVGDIHDTHAYPGPWSDMPEPSRAAVNGEFGGIAMTVDNHMLFSGKVMGYGATLSEGRLVTKKYQALMENAYGIKDTRGTSAVVYTQLTDVEQELNGILTYDRAVIKPDIAITAAANKGEFLPLPPNPNPPLVPASDEDPQTSQYTTEKPGDAWTQPDFDASAWKSGKGAFGHDFPNVGTQWTTSDIWLRREFTLPQDIPAKLTLLISHDEDAEVYVNGVLAGSVTGFSAEYVPVPMSEAARAALKPGKNILAVHCHQTIGGQGIDVGIVKTP